MRALVIMTAAILLVGCRVEQEGTEDSSITRTHVLRQDLGESRELLQVRVDFAPNASFGMHTHPGDEVAYVAEGALTYEIEGAPARKLIVGESLFIPTGTRHAARNSGSGRSTELATYLVEKGKPLVVPAPGTNWSGHRSPFVGVGW